MACFGIADEHERRPRIAEGAPHDVPLHRVGVLELVHEDDRVSRRERRLQATGPRSGSKSVSRRRMRTSS